MTKKKSDKPAVFEIDENELLHQQKEEERESEDNTDEFFDQSGYEYRVSRVFPNDGFLGTIPSPSGFQAIKDAYGGGIYNLLRIRLDTRKLAGKRTIKVAGPPKPVEAESTSFEDLRRENEQLKGQLSGKKTDSLLDNPRIQELLVLKSLGGSSDNNAMILKLLADSGDKKVEALLEGMQLGRTLSGNVEPEETSIWEKLASGVISLLERKGIEFKTVNRSGQELKATHTKITTQEPKPEAPEQMLWQNLIEELTDIILDGIEQKIPPAEVATQIKVTAGSFLLSLVRNLSPDQLLSFLESRYADDPEIMAHLKNPETRTYLTNILEELKK
jgi:hypothetical protein